MSRVAYFICFFESFKVKYLIMPSIYTNLKKSDRKYIAREKARIRKQFLDLAKQEEMITDLYKRMVGKAAVVPTEKVVAPAIKRAVKKAAPKAKK